MAHPLDSAFFKLARAAEHLEEVESAVNVYRDTHPYIALPYYNFDAPEHTVRLRIIGQPPPRIGLIFAEVLQNTRSALDHMVYQLADLDPDHPRGERTQYPICDDPKKWDRLPPHYLEGVPEPYRTRIRQTQPSDGRYSLLAPLMILNDRDKHRVLETLVVNVHTIEYTFDPPVRGFRQAEGPHSEDNAILGWFRSDKRVNMNMQVTFEVAFGMPSGTRIGTPGARTLIGQVGEILARFRDAFDPPGHESAPAEELEPSGGSPSPSPSG